MDRYDGTLRGGPFSKIMLLLNNIGWEFVNHQFCKTMTVLSLTFLPRHVGPSTCYSMMHGSNTWPPKSTTRPCKVWRALIQPSRSWITTSKRQLTWQEPVHCSLALSSPRGTIRNSTERSSPFISCVFYLTPNDTGFAAPGLLHKERNVLIFCHGSMNCHCALRCTYWRQDHLLCCRWSAISWTCQTPAESSTVLPGLESQTMFLRTVLISRG